MITSASREEMRNVNPPQKHFNKLKSRGGIEIMILKFSHFQVALWWDSITCHPFTLPHPPHHITYHQKHLLFLSRPSSNDLLVSKHTSYYNGVLFDLFNFICDFLNFNNIVVDSQVSQWKRIMNRIEISDEMLNCEICSRVLLLLLLL